MCAAVHFECRTAKVVDLSLTINECHQDLAESGRNYAVVCDASRYIGILNKDELLKAKTQNPSAGNEPLNYLCPFSSPVLPDNCSPLDIRRFIQEHRLGVLPFMDRKGRLTRLMEPQNALSLGLYENAAVIMAGGFGMRLRPITENIPKPMVPLVDGKLLDRILDHLLDCGFYRHYVAVHYLKEQVMEYLKDGSQRGLKVEYLEEERPLGTAGSLRKIIGKESLPVLVTNGDVITNQRFGEVLRFHNQQRSDITVVCKEDTVDISYGVVEKGADGTLKSLSEKPSFSYLINTGIYVVNPDVLDSVPDNPCNMTDLIKAVKKKGGRVSVFQTREYWRDVGTIDCYAQIMKDIRSGLVRSFRTTEFNVDSVITEQFQEYEGNGRATARGGNGAG